MPELEKPRHKVLLQNRVTWLIVITLLSLGAFSLIVTRTDPYFGDTGTALALFYSSSFFFMTSLYSLMLLTFKRWRLKEDLLLVHFNIALRQGILLSICTLACAALLMLGLLRIWNGLLLVIFITLLEAYFSSHDQV